MGHATAEARREYQAKWRAANRVKIRKYIKAYREVHGRTPHRREYERAWQARRAGTVDGRAFVMLKEAKARAVKYRLPCDLTLEWVHGKLLEALAAGVVTCEGRKPHTASLDQRVPKQGYLTTNVDVVPSWFNYAKHDYDGAELRIAILKWMAHVGA